MSITALAEGIWGALVARRAECAFIAGYLAFELAMRSRYVGQLRKPRVLIDVLYALLFRLGIFTLLLDGPTAHWVRAHLTLSSVSALPEWARVVAYLLVLDFTNYWIHRIEHAVPALWAFHQVHHSQDELSIMTTYRNHPLDSWMRSVIGPTVFMLLFGVSPVVWLWLGIAWDILLNLSHLEVDWTWGPLRRVFVSPVSHAIHHSVEPRHQNRNFGANLAVWDYLFGTADAGTARPAAVGLPGWRVRESVPAHLWAPIRGVARHLRGLPMDELAPLRAAEPPAPVASRPVSS
ncbi:MAG: sterol desaturase family protein [Gemmatimonadetes bacterium]|nr:sterol desaturase family protein [Gemmatimonadota bacterium]